MLGMSAFKRKPRQFSYQPIYHDPQEEARKERECAALGEKNENHVPGSYIHNRRRDRMLGLDRPQKSTVDKRRMLTRLIIFVALLCLVAYMIIKSDVILKIVQLQG